VDIGTPVKETSPKLKNILKAQERIIPFEKPPPVLRSLKPNIEHLSYKTKNLITQTRDYLRTLSDESSNESPREF
jgi:hypothetical protein